MFPISLRTLADQERHDYVLKTYILNKNEQSGTRKFKRDIDVIKEHHRFLWNDDEEGHVAASDSWEERLARRYYDKLFKEYCIADLTRHKENKVALRWRTEQEVVSGKGQFQCGSRKCEERNELRSWEVNFAYLEHGERKNALVKLRLCPEHSTQLNYTSRKREVKRLKHIERQKEKEIRRHHKRKHRKEQKTSMDYNDSNDNDNNGSSVEIDDSLSLCQDNEITSNENETESSTNEAEESTSEAIWSKKPDLEAETQTRETEFERYLEDLLL